MRFAVGDKVRARVGKRPDLDKEGFFPGVILKQWDQGNAYRIQLQDENKTNVWGPIDEDGFVRAPLVLDAA